MTILDHIRSLEAYSSAAAHGWCATIYPRGARPIRAATSSPCAGLSPEQELLTLVHELAHWLLHREPQAPAWIARVFEYEAEAVEALVMARLGLPHPQRGVDLDGESPTDNLLSASVTRVIWASRRICGALGLDGRDRPP